MRNLKFINYVYEHSPDLTVKPHSKMAHSNRKYCKDDMSLISSIIWIVLIVCRQGFPTKIIKMLIHCVDI